MWLQLIINVTSLCNKVFADTSVQLHVPEYDMHPIEACELRLNMPSTVHNCNKRGSLICLTCSSLKITLYISLP